MGWEICTALTLQNLSLMMMMMKMMIVPLLLRTCININLERSCCCCLAELSLARSDDPRCCPNKAMMRLQLGSVGLMTRADSGHTS